MNKWIVNLTVIAFVSYAQLGYAQKNSYPVSPVDPKVTTEYSVANSDEGSTVIPSVVSDETAAENRQNKEDAIVPPHSFAVAVYRPNYILPYYYTASPYNNVYSGHTPFDETIKGSEFKYQISFKIPLRLHAIQSRSSLYFAYTQMAYWQFYSPYQFFRETDYEPELFLTTDTDLHIGKFHLDFMNIGIVHQSNGDGGILERAWNRIYVEAILSTDHFMMSIKPWYIMHNGDLDTYNPHIGTYMGYGRLLMAYKYHEQVVSLAVHSIFENYARYATGELTYSFPLFTPYLKGYAQLFSGYGQSLIEYNHRTNSVGVGVALNDWI